MVCCECLRHLHTESFSCTVSPIHMLLLCSLIATPSFQSLKLVISLFRFSSCSSLWRFTAEIMLYKTRVQCSSNFACLHTAGMYNAAAWQQAVFLGQVGILNTSTTIIAVWVATTDRFPPKGWPWCCRRCCWHASKLRWLATKSWPAGCSSLLPCRMKLSGVPLTTPCHRF